MRTSTRLSCLTKKKCLWVLFFIFFLNPNHKRKWVWWQFRFVIVNNIKRLCLVGIYQRRSWRGGFDHGSSWLLLLILRMIFSVWRLERKHGGRSSGWLWLWTRVEEISGKKVVLLKTSHERVKLIMIFGLLQTREKKLKEKF